MLTNSAILLYHLIKTTEHLGIMKCTFLVVIWDDRNSNLTTDRPITQEHTHISCRVVCTENKSPHNLSVHLYHSYTNTRWLFRTSSNLWHIKMIDHWYVFANMGLKKVENVHGTSKSLYKVDNFSTR